MRTSLLLVLFYAAVTGAAACFGQAVVLALGLR